MNKVPYSKVNHLLEKNVERELIQIGVYPTYDVLSAYCEYLFALPNIVSLSSRKRAPVGVIVFRPLDWDSEIYGIKVGTFSRVAITAELKPERQIQLIAELVKNATTYAITHQVDMLVCRVSLQDLLWIQELEKEGFRIMDVQCPLVINDFPPELTKVKTSRFTINIRDLTPKDISKVVSFGTSAFRYSHLYKDWRLPINQTDKLHEAWLRNDCQGKADFVLVAEINGSICGFVAGLWDDIQDEIMGVGHGHIDLIAVEQEMHGYGIGSQLIVEAFRRFLNHSASVITVSTQATNLRAIRFYQDKGFKLSGFKVTLHAWPRING